MLVINIYRDHEAVVYSLQHADAVGTHGYKSEYLLRGRLEEVPTETLRQVVRLVGEQLVRWSDTGAMQGGSTALS
jgi:hypothetical protein